MKKNWIVAAVLSVIVALSTFILQMGNFHLLWHNYRKSELELKRLKESILYEIRLEISKQEVDNDKISLLMKLFYSRYANIEANETYTYFSSIKPANEVKA